MQYPTILTATNADGDTLLSRGERLPAIFVRANTEQVVLRERTASALIAMLLSAQADFRLRKDAPPGLDFVLEFHVRTTRIRVAIIDGRILPAHGEWLMRNYDLIAVGAKVHLLRTTAGTAFLAGALNASHA